MEFGTLLASRVITKVGGRTALPTRKDLPGMMAGVSEDLRLAIARLV